MARINCIKKKILEKGDTWIVAETPESIQKMLKNVIKDMIYGNFNYEEVGNYFLDGKFIDNLIIASKNEYEENNAFLIYTAYYMNCFPATPKINNHLMKCQSLCYIYSVIINKLQSVKAYGNIGILADIPSILGAYRNFIN